MSDHESKTYWGCEVTYKNGFIELSWCNDISDDVAWPLAISDRRKDIIGHVKKRRLNDDVESARSIKVKITEVKP